MCETSCSRSLSVVLTLYSVFDVSLPIIFGEICVADCRAGVPLDTPEDAGFIKERCSLGREEPIRTPSACGATFEFPLRAVRVISRSWIPTTKSYTRTFSASTGKAKIMTNNKENITIVKPKSLSRKNSELDIENPLSIQSPRYLFIFLAQHNIFQSHKLSTKNRAWFNNFSLVREDVEDSLEFSPALGIFLELVSTPLMSAKKKERRWWLLKSSSVSAYQGMELIIDEKERHFHTFRYNRFISTL